MQNITKSLKLPFQFDTEKLADDLSLIVEEKWLPHYNTTGYSGNWKILSLYGEDGDDSNIFALSNSNSIKSETPILKKCHYFKEVIETFKCPILTARIMRLGAGAEIKPHRDHELGYEDGNFRLHIPIVTNSDVHFILDGSQITMLPGECWYTNVNYVHSVSNKGESDRLHLVIDGERNEWSDQLFFSLAPEKSFRPAPKEDYTPDTIKRMIEELKRRNEPATNKLIEELTTKLSGVTTKNKSHLK